MWTSPVPFRLTVTDDSESFFKMSPSETGLPVTPHVGAFGAVRKNHIHEGVDLYVPEGTPVRAVEDGEIVAIMPFTGPGTDPPSPWWHDTMAIMVEGESGVVLYGEMIPFQFAVGEKVQRGEFLGHVIAVLTKNKGRPMSMLHLELYEHGVREPVSWEPGQERPKGLLDPTEKLFR